ncbi:MAG: hypothetical protein AAB834_04295, partial [Patescibacteria group bacterium]
MENNPFHPLERADSEGSSKDKKSEGFATPYRPAERITYEAPERVERMVPKPPIEGIISWRERNEDELRRNLAAEADNEDIEKDEESDDDDEESEKSKSTKTPSLRLAQPAIPPTRTIAEAQAPQSEGEAELAEEGDGAEKSAVPDPTEAVVFDDALVESLPPLVSRETYVQPQVSMNVESTAADPVADVPRWPNQAPITPSARQYESQDPDDSPTVTYTHQAGAGGRPPLPPVGSPNPNAAYNQPNPNNTFANQYMHPGVQIGQFNAAPPAPNTAGMPVMPIERPQFTSNRDPRLGPVAATLGLGLVAEHIGRKRADRKLEKRVNERAEEQAKQQEQVYTTDQQLMQERQRQFKNEQEYQTAEMQRLRQAQERFVAPPA